MRGTPANKSPHRSPRKAGWLFKSCVEIAERRHCDKVDSGTFVGKEERGRMEGIENHPPKAASDEIVSLVDGEPSRFRISGVPDPTS